MRVLYQNRANALDEWGGDTTQMVKTAEELRHLGVDVDVASENMQDYSKYDLVHVFNVQRSLEQLKQVEQAKTHDIPVVLSPIYWNQEHIARQDAINLNYGPRYARLLGRIHWRLPYTGTQLVTFRRRRRTWLCARRMIELADMLLPNSYAELEQLVTVFHAHWARTRSVIIPSGVDEPEAPPGWDSDADQDLTRDLPEEFVLEVARISSTKGQLSLIRSLSVKEEPPLVFVGGNLETAYGQRCRREGERRGNVFFLGEIAHRRLAPAYRRARVHALPSLRESPGLASLEAGSYGANCVVSIDGPVTEYFSDCVWYCDPENLDSIRNAVMTAWAAPRDGRLRSRVLNNFTWKRTAELTLRAYSRILKDGTHLGHRGGP